MSSEIPDSDKVQLLFKEFTGVTNVKQSTAFPGENFAFTDYIFGNRVFNEDIPINLPSGLQSVDLDSCGNIQDGQFIDLPEYKLRFYKKLKLDPAEPGSLKSWYISDGSGGSILKDAIPFKYDPANSSYRQFCYRRTSSGPPATYFQIQQYSNPTFWLFDYKSGFLEFYGDETTLTPYFSATDGPHFSFFKYIGEKGAAGGGGGGDASGNLDLSGNLSVGGDADISGNLTVVGDASFCNVLVNCDLDVSGNTDMSGNLTVVKDVTFNKNIIANYSGSNTNLIQSENFVLPAPIPSPTNPNNEETIIIAQVNPSPSTPNEPFNATGYFTIEINSGTDPSNYFKAHFIAGIINDSQSNNPPGFNYYSFIKVLSVERGLFGFGINNPGILNIKLFKSVGTNMVYLALTYSSISTIPIRIRLYKNSENIIGEDNHLSWVLRSQLIDPTDVLMKNIYIGPGPDIPVPPAISPQNPLHPVEPFTTTTQYNIIDNSMNIYGNLYNTGNLRVDGDTQLQDTDICGNLYVDRDASFNRSVYIRDTIDVSNNANIQNDLTVRGNLDVYGNIRGRNNLKIDVDAVIGNNMDVLNSLDIGQNQQLTLTENTILSTTASSNFYTGLRSEANNFYYKVNSSATGQGFVLNLNKTNDDHAFRIIDVSGSSNNLFKVGGSGLTQTQNIYPFINNTYDIGYKSPSNPNADFRYNNLYVNNVDTNTLITDDISANKFYQKLSGSSLLDFSSINITPSGSLNYYDIAYLVNPTVVSGNKLTQGSALIEIYLVEYANSIGSLDKIEYIKCEISEFRASTASITVISAGNIPDSSDRILKSLKLNYGFNNSTPPYFDPGALFQVGLEDSTSTTQKLFCRIYENNPVDSHQTGTSVIVNIEEGKWDLALSNTPNNSPTFGTPAKSYESNYIVDLDFNPNGGTTTQPLSGGKLMYVNDKDSKFTSNVRFVEDVNFNKDINVDSDITATNLYVNDIYNTTPPLNIDICGNVYELTKTELNLNDKNIQNVSELNTTANSDLTVGNNLSNVTFDCDVSMNKLNVNILEVEKANGNDVFKVDADNNTANLDIPLNLYRDTIDNIQSGSKALSDYSIGIVNNIGSSVNASNTYQTDALAWKPNISGTASLSLIVNEQTVHIYNRQLTGGESNGGIDPYTSTSVTLNGLKYKRYVSGGGLTRTSFFGCMPTSNDGTSSSFPISSKLHFMRKTWITGIYLNSPFNDVSGNAGNIFNYGSNSFIDLEIGSGTNWTRVYRLGNPTASNADSYGFPASASYNSSSGGIRVVLAADDWIYIPEGTNISQCVRFKYYVNNTIWVIDEASGTSYHESEIDGYLTYIQKPLVVLN